MLLLNNGADTTLRNGQGKTAMDLAEKDENMTKLLSGARRRVLFVACWRKQNMLFDGDAIAVSLPLTAGLASCGSNRFALFWRSPANGDDAVTTSP